MSSQEFVPVTLPDGQTLHVQVTQIHAQTLSASRIDASTRVTGFAANDEADGQRQQQQQFESVLSVIKGIGQSLVETLKEIKPQEATVEFGLEVGLESGKLTALLVKGTGSSTMKITMTWKNDATPPPG